MQNELVLVAFIMAVGLSVSAALTHLYQGVAKQQAMLRYDGKTYLRMLANLALSFLCGPYIMLQMGWKQEENGTIALTSVLIAALVAFGWAFITGILALGIYIAVFP